MMHHMGVLLHEKNKDYARIKPRTNGPPVGHAPQKKSYRFHDSPKFPLGVVQPELFQVGAEVVRGEGCPRYREPRVKACFARRQARGWVLVQKLAD